MKSDRPITTAGGATFTAPGAWELVDKRASVTLIAPENDLRITIVSISAAGDAEAAADHAWRAHTDAPARAVTLAVAEAARGGWDAIEIRQFQTSPGEHRLLQMQLFRRGVAWTGVVLDGSLATFEKRMSAAVLVTASLRAPGFVRESFAGRKANLLDEARIATLQAFVRDGMDKLGIPGAALALVQDGETVFAGGLGVRKLGEPAPVGVDTRFMIASNTKSLTTLMLATLVDDGKLGWDMPAAQIYPEFRFGGPNGRAVRVRDLLSAATGLPRRDLAWSLTSTRDTPAAAVFDLLAEIEPTSRFGEVYQYNNTVAAAAGYIGAHAAFPEMELGAAYDRAMQERVFGPLGMARTTFDLDDAWGGDHASPHSQGLSGEIVTVDPAVFASLFTTRPTGGAWSTVRDMARYVELELAKGALRGGGRAVSEANLLFRREPGVRIGEDAAYGNGLRIDQANDVTVLRHGGSLPGFMSDFYAVPSAGVGAVLLTNADNGMYLINPFKRRLLEVLFDGAEEASAELERIAARRVREVAEMRDALPAVPDASVVDALAPSYRSEEIGRLVPERSNGTLRFRSAGLGAQVTTRTNADGSISFVVIEPGLIGLSFLRDDGADGRALVISEGQHSYRFVEER